LTGLCRFFTDRFIRENTYPDFTATTDMVSYSPPCCLNLSAGNPGTFQRLQPKITEGKGISGLGFTPAVSPVNLAVFNPLRL
jgi:hypothetical protein